jgi:hypothetical protein
MKRFLILGGDGMLGHQLLQYLQGRHAVKVTLRKNLRTILNINYSIVIIAILGLMFETLMN